MLPFALTALLLADYQSVNGPKMYYEVHGRGPHLLLLHGGTATVATSWGEQIPYFARSRKVIAPEQVGHGHTGDREEPYSYARMADDTATLLGQLGIQTLTSTVRATAEWSDSTWPHATPAAFGS